MIDRLVSLCWTVLGFSTRKKFDKKVDIFVSKSRGRKAWNIEEFLRIYSVKESIEFQKNM